MQDPTAFQVQPVMKPPFPEQEQLKCPRCDSTNTKFCYYNNYNLSQPRHFCKNCKRYWTKGGALRNIPVGGGSRKNTKRSSSNSNCKRSASSSTSPSPSISSASSAPQASAPAPGADPTQLYSNPIDQDRRLLNIGNGGGFSSLLASTGHMGLGSLLEGLNSSGSSSSLKMVQMQMGEFGENAGSGSGPLVNSNLGRKPLELEMQMQSTGNSDSERFLGLQNGDSGCWNGNNGWSNLAIYTPGSSFQ